MHDILANWLPVLLGLAVLLPLFSFFLILPFGKWLGKWGGVVAASAIIGSCVLSFIALGLWLVPLEDGHFPEDIANAHHAAETDGGHGGEHHGEHVAKPAYSGICNVFGLYWVLGRFGDSQLAITYYIDTLTIVMFCMVTLIASCIHFYAMGYMHDELHDITDHEVTLEDGSHLKRPGRYARFFQYLSLFCFAMLGLVYAGNIAMVFIFWELVGICSYFLIGFYIERKSASTAANKAFIVNRVGDFGMIIGLLIFWTGLGTLSFGDYSYEDGAGKHEVASIFSELRTEENDYQLVSTYKDVDKDEIVATPNTPDGVVRLGARGEIRKLRLKLVAEGKSEEEIEQAITAHIPFWRDPVKYRYDQKHPGETEHHGGEAEPGHAGAEGESGEEGEPSGEEGAADGEEGEAHAEPAGLSELVDFESQAKYGYWLLIVGGLGIFCGCVGKSAQFPLHVWLPDAMEGPTPVSALVHSATMVAAGVYLVGRFFPAFVPEVLLVIAIIGAITLFMAATIAIVATDIKRVLAYSTISQLGYMMLALGLGGWVAGLMHLVTHAFFKSLLFMCSGSVIHAVHTNEMPQMGGLLKKMPITAITMLIGCLAIIGASLPFVVGLSGYYSKDAILEQAFWFMQSNTSSWTSIFFIVAAGGAAITAFYMFRLWFMTFMGAPRDQHRYDHAHESPRTMTVPLMITAFFAITVAWSPFGFLPFSGLSLGNLLEQARPEGALVDYYGVWAGVVLPNEHGSHEFWSIKFPVTLLAFATAIFGVSIAAAFYWFRAVDPEETRRQFSGAHRFLENKWWFDELYNYLFVQPAMVVGRVISSFDRNWIDRFIDGIASCAKWVSRKWTEIADQGIIDGLVNLTARWTWSTGLWFKNIQTGSIRQYVVFIVIGAIVLFLVIGFFWSPTFAQ